MNSFVGRLTPGLFAMVLSVSANATDYRPNYDVCHTEARQISGYDGQASQGFISGAVRGGLAGGAVGAAGGWVTGNNSGKAAKRGAAIGAVIGGARVAAQNKATAAKKETYDRALEQCLARKTTD